MARMNDSGRTLGRVRDTGTALPKVDLARVGEALGAQEVQVSRTVPREAVLLATLRTEILPRLRSSGGRPALRGATRRPKIPVEPADWAGLNRAARRLSRVWGRSLTAGQLASQLLREKIRELLATLERVK